MANAPFDQLKATSFLDVQFPYEHYTVTGGIRKHKHEYPHSPGAAVEKLGRELYEIRISVNFTAGLTPKPPYDDLLLSLATLRAAFEQQTTGPLNIPHIGVIQACADKWSESATHTNRSTIKAELTFFEDLNSALALRDTVTVSSTALGTLADNFTKLTADITPDPVRSSFNITPVGPNTLNIFQAISALSTSISGIQDQQELYGALVSSKIDGLIALFKQADTQVSQLNDPDNYPALDAMHALWQSALQLQSDLQNTGFAARLYLTPMRMSISQVSAALYGNTFAAAQLMQLNDLTDPLDIPAQTQIIYYPALEQLAA